MARRARVLQGVVYDVRIIVIRVSASLSAVVVVNVFAVGERKIEHARKEGLGGDANDTYIIHAAQDPTGHTYSRSPSGDLDRRHRPPLDLGRCG
jgi:hypothetical protein